MGVVLKATALLEFLLIALATRVVAFRVFVERRLSGDVANFAVAKLVALAMVLLLLCGSGAFAAEPGEVEPARDTLSSTMLRTMGVPLSERDETTWVEVFPLGMHEVYGDLWAAYASHDDEVFVALFARLRGGAWSKPLARWHDTCCPTGFVEGVPINIGPSEEVWFTVFGIEGAHAGQMLTFHFDGERLKESGMLSDGGASSNIGEIVDLNGDGVDEVLFLDTDPYVFVYAANVAEISARLVYWNGEKFVMVHPSESPEGASTARQEDADLVRRLVDADLWVEAASLASVLAAQASDDMALRWWAVLIRKVASMRADHAAQSGQPLLTAVFAGDYAKAFELMRAHPPAAVFSPESPLLAGTVAEGLHETMAYYLLDYAGRALSMRPYDPFIHAVLALALAFNSPGDLTAARDAMDRAVALAPAVEYLRQAQAHLRQP